TWAEDVLAALQSDDAQLSRIANAARERVLAEHTGAQRAVQFEEIIERVQPHEMAAA
ncbi:MAG: glycosyltransferase, partial [Candidatus Udaeobacter sp.]